MMTAAAARIMTGLLTAELKAGRIRIEGDRIYRGKQQVEPRLSFVRADDRPATPTAAPGVPRSAGQRHGESELAYPMFAPVPPYPLVPAEKETTDHARMAQQQQRPTELLRQYQEAAQRFGWPKISRPCHRTR